ncbi:MAG: cysteine desulfurase family protein [Pirellulales bacterium]
MAHSIYLDNNATSVIDARVVQAMRDLELNGIANPASQHRAGRQALRHLELAKESILRSVGAPVEGMSAAQIVITSGGTESNNLALHAFTHQKPGLVIVGSMEHPSLLLAAELTALCLNPVRQLPAKADGTYDLDRLSELLDSVYSGREAEDRVALVSLMLANNETGVMNDIASVTKLCNRYEVPVHCDVIQAAGKVEIDMTELGLAALTVNAHKLHGPVGVGALVISTPLEARPTVIGGGQQLGWRAGTEPVALTVGLARTLKLAEEARNQGVYDQVKNLRDLFEKLIVESLDFVTINGGQSPRVPQTSNMAFVGIDRQALQMALDLEGVACSAGAACSSGSSRPSTTLLAMGLDDSIVSSSLRFSLSRITTEEEVQQAAKIVINVASKLKR